ncbi:hypothetical protein MRB53_021835 [Persea americana]|uniref:Uncharacterized protein n=1 Tax=Persea americana TaxID=3435 RepID=A0ACC2L661_PERAE|nr:hypothetical protein MRB53_021835 [Persea americana]
MEVCNSDCNCSFVAEVGAEIRQHQGQGFPISLPDTYAKPPSYTFTEVSYRGANGDRDARGKKRTGFLDHVGAACYCVYLNVGQQMSPHVID